ncbi:hypothetical protein BZARG_1198 [Bizionia argentinensis JUB59]|uniref:Uncharacterized protein n=1 Tax=Bizionia argentinensis JUB59 TaxID=1046627 RepID=G2ECS9_9FLAO|nr:hypothetical protein [Bizionia argentinensis]EGV43790.1 hypothetical protein BZARG_1198 [Bizionia argentinensis JUB59]
MNKLIVLAIFFSVNLFSQEITEEQRDFITRALHGQGSERFNKTTHNAFKFEEYKEGDFFNEIVTQEQISACSELVKETAQLSVNEKNQLVFTGKLTERFNMQTTGVFSVDLIESNLLKENGEPFELNTFYNSNSGYGKINFKTDVKSEYAENEKISGFVEFELSYLIGYDKIELTLNDIGKTFTLNDCQYAIINIKGNEIILDKFCEQENEINVINFNQKGQVAKPFAYMELMRMIEKDTTISKENFTRNNRQTYKMVRDLFEKNPKITLNEFKELFTLNKLIEMKEDGKYYIVENIAPFEDRFILYTPKFQSEKIKVNIK